MNLSSDCFIFLIPNFDYLSINGNRNWVYVVSSSEMHYLSIGQWLTLSPIENLQVFKSSLAKLEDLNLILRERRLRWFGHVERSTGTCDIEIVGRRGREAQANMEETDGEGLP